MNKHLLFLFLLLVMQANVQAQTGFYEPGYILQAGDTLKGLVERTDEIKLSLGVNFKKDPSSDVRHFGPWELTGFGFQGSSLHFEPVKATLKELSPNDKVIRYAKKLVTGYASLYKLQLQDEEHHEEFLKDNTHTYVVKKDSVYLTLAQHELIIDSRAGVDKRYLGMLTFLMNDCSGIALSSFSSMPFKDEAMVKLIQRYNVCKNPAGQTVEYQYKVKSTMKRGPEAGISILNVPLNTNTKSSQGYWAISNTQVSSSQGYWAGFFWDMMKPDLSRKISSRFGINYLYMRYDLTGIQYDGRGYSQITTKEEAHFVRLPFLAQYNFMKSPSNKYAPFLNFGITVQGSAYSVFRQFDFVPFLSLGAGTYVKDFKVSLNVDNFGIYPKGDKIFSLGVGYILKKTNKD